MKRRFLAAAMAVLASVSACTSVPRTEAVYDGVSWAGRLALRIDGTQPQSVSARFELRGQPNGGRFGLVTPIGTQLMQADWSAQGARLRLPDGERLYPDMEALTRDSLGEALPVGALFDWLQGRPVAGTAFTATATGFAQSGWEVNTSEQSAGRIELARRAPAPIVTLRIIFDPT